MNDAERLLAEAEEAIEAWLCELDGVHKQLLVAAESTYADAVTQLTSAAGTLEEARRDAKELVSGAEEQSTRILAAARDDAEKLVASARAEARRILDDAESEVARRLEAIRAAEAEAGQRAIPEPPRRRRRFLFFR